MKQLQKIIYFYFVILLLLGTLFGCAGYTNGEATTDSSENSSVLVSPEEHTSETDESMSKGELEDSTHDDTNNISSEESVNKDSDWTSAENSDLNLGGQEDDETLSQYSSEHIEYARVWLQLGVNQEIDELNVRHIHAGEPINPNDDSSASYPEDVIQLTGSRLVDGSVTYSGNGDGTINIYAVPLRWDGNYPAGGKFYEDVIEDTELVYVDPNKDEEVLTLIKLLNVH